MEENLNQEIENETKTSTNKKFGTKYKVIIVIVVIAIFALSAVGLIIAFSISRDSNDNLYELDTIPTEEMDKARKSFKQYRYENNSKIIDYNFYTPENIS